MAKFLPGIAVSNDEMEEYLGMIGGKPSKARKIILRSNGIRQRYYALSKGGNITHTNAEITAKAINGLFNNGFSFSDVEMLTCGTTSPDQLLPSHAAMVHGLLEGGAVEISSFTSACMAGIQAMKTAYLSVMSGNTQNAVCAGSERLSCWFLSDNYAEEAKKLEQLKDNPYIAFEKEFLRWMLSDGAGAALLQNRPGKELSLRIEWIELTSYADSMESCMYAGASKDDSGGLRGWYEHEPAAWLRDSLFSMKQDVRLLKENIVPLGMKFLKEVIKKRDFDINEIDYFLPHLSSEFFRNGINDELEKEGIPVPREKWFTNLSTVGNVGAASAYLMLEELFNSGKLKKGEKILIMIPESARFSYSYVLLTVF